MNGPYNGGETNQEQSRLESALSAYLRENPPATSDACPDDETLLAYASKSLTGPDCTLVEEHIRRCSACIGEVARFRSSKAGASSLLHRKPRGFPRRQVQPQPASVTPRGRLTGFRMGLVFASVAAVVVAGGLLFHVLSIGSGGRPAHERQGPVRMAQLPEDQQMVRGPRTRGPGVVFTYLSFVYRNQGSRDIAEVAIPAKSGISIASGDEYALRFEAAQRGWVYVTQVDPKGTLTVLFPNETFGTQSNPVEAGRVYQTPSAKTLFVLDQNAGRETIYVAFCPERQSEWEDIRDGIARAADGDELRELRSQLETQAVTAGGRCVRFEFDHTAAHD